MSVNTIPIVLFLQNPVITVVHLTTLAVNVLLANQNRYIATVTLVRADIRHLQADVPTDILQQARPVLVVQLPELATNVK